MRRIHHSSCEGLFHSAEASCEICSLLLRSTGDSDSDLIIHSMPDGRRMCSWYTVKPSYNHCNITFSYLNPAQRIPRSPILRETVFMLRLFPSRNPPYALLPPISSALPTDDHTWSLTARATAKTWLENCTNQHIRCNAVSSTKWAPSHLIDLGPCETSEKPSTSSHTRK